MDVVAVTACQSAEWNAGRVQQTNACGSVGNGACRTLAGVRPITMSGNLLLDHASPPAFNEAAVATVVDLIAVSDVFLLFRVQNEEHKRDILQAIGQIPQFAWNPTTQMGLQVHKILFCSSSAGNIALVRQIEPVVHIEGKQDVTVGLRPFLPSIVFLSPIYELPAQTSSTGRDSVEWHQSLDAYYLTLTA
ncbi:hypothetical protein, variant [Aphanomyces invadans]|uniref:Uncharacterized protein n=1 Tax=Aphanomyces invadans TaxID=157072 RepID=A0A024USA9_9STRA|nr:hypothetical protein, variant [Aphanomyces invadans]ETW08792.1 hypothetical protein, variant [Aphanomyces invadans]|eukprot:XP_008862597.1 hypothetical protein, variant [Aphanomyces invadans]